MQSAGWSSLLWFAVIVVAIPFVLVLLKRTPLGHGSAHGAMRLVGALPIAQQQRIVTVEVGEGADRRWLVLGVTAQSITTLHTMAPQTLSAPPSGEPTFAQVLKPLWSRRGDGDAR